jgi:hypothetical protein
MELASEVIFSSSIEGNDSGGRGFTKNRYNAIFEKIFFSFVVCVLSSFCYYSGIRLGLCIVVC